MKNSVVKYLITAIVILSMAVVGLICYFTSPRYLKPCDDVEKSDTIKETDTCWLPSDTVYLDKFVPKPVPVPQYISDTEWMPCQDSVPITQQYFKNDVLDLWVSGFNVQVDSMRYRETHIHDTVIIKETTQINNTKIKRFNVGVGVGTYYYPFKGSFNPYMECEASYRFKNKIGVNAGVGLIGDIPQKDIQPFVKVGVTYNF